MCYEREKMTNKNQYVDPQPIEREEVLRILSSGKTEDIEATLISVALLDDCYEFALSTIIQGASSTTAAIRGTAILCLGHLARIHKQLPEDPVLDIVRAGLIDDNTYVRGQAENAADDIATFIPKLARKIPHKLRDDDIE